MQIWTEDSGSGFVFWNWINNIVFYDKFKVVKGHGNRTVLDKINSNKSNELIIVIVDKMLDNLYTERTYNSIENALRTHKNIFLPIYSCTERSFLTYGKLDLYVSKVNQNIDKLRQIVLMNSENFGSINIHDIKDTLFWKFYRDNVKADLTGNKFSEHIYNALLATYTNNTYAKINKDKIGPCWLFDCCTIDRKTCKMKSEHTELDKINDITAHSEFGYTISEIFKCIDTFLNCTYKHNKYDDKWKKLITNELSKLEIAYYADDHMRRYAINKWTYENIYRRIHG